MEHNTQNENSKLLIEIKESIARIEGKIELVNERNLNLEKRVSKLEENNTWTYRLIIGQFLIALIGYFVLSK